MTLETNPLTSGRPRTCRSRRRSSAHRAPTSVGRGWCRWWRRAWSSHLSQGRGSSARCRANVPDWCRGATYAIFEPSGDQAGWTASVQASFGQPVGVAVSWCAFVPSASATQSCEPRSPLPSKTMRVPSGDQWNVGDVHSQPVEDHVPIRPVRSNEVDAVVGCLDEDPRIPRPQVDRRRPRRSDWEPQTERGTERPSERRMERHARPVRPRPGLRAQARRRPGWRRSGWFEAWRRSSTDGEPPVDGSGGRRPGWPPATAARARPVLPGRRRGCGRRDRAGRSCGTLLGPGRGGRPLRARPACAFVA